MMQHELTAHVDLLNDKGELNARGWARQLIATYNRESIAAGWLRIKEWDYYCVLAPDYGIAMTIDRKANGDELLATIRGDPHQVLIRLRAHVRRACRDAHHGP